MLQRVTIIRLQCLDLLHLLNPIGFVPKPLHIGMTSRVRVLNETTETRALILPELHNQVIQMPRLWTFSRQLP